MWCEAVFVYVCVCSSQVLGVLCLIETWGDGLGKEFGFSFICDLFSTRVTWGRGATSLGWLMGSPKCSRCTKGSR